jgi:flagella basal body P-ring formation protein FlgA
MTSCRHVVEGRVRSLPWFFAGLCLVSASLILDTAAASAGSFTVRLKPDASVKSSNFVLADIADLMGDNEATLARIAGIKLGPITDVRVVSRSEVLGMIRDRVGNAEEVLLTGADFTRVSVATRTADAAMVASALKSFLISSTPWREDEIEIRSIESLKPLRIPDGDLQLRVTSRGAPSNFKSALLPLELVVDGKVWRTLWIKADIRVRAKVVQVAKPVAFRGILKTEDVREQVCDIEDPRTEYFRTPSEAVGKTAKRVLGTGELLSRASMEEASLVRSGETVRLLGISGSVSMTAKVRALQNGKLGEAIKVRNIDTDRLIVAVVTGRGEVCVRN